jgi:hypothetical protein
MGGYRGYGSFGQPYVGDDRTTINGPYNYGVFSPRIPYAFPSYYEDPHLESGRGAYHGFGGGFGEVTLPTGQTFTCDASAFIDKWVSKTLRVLPTWLSWTKDIVSSKLKSVASNLFGELIAKSVAGRSAFEAWFKESVSANLAGGVVSVEMINSVLLPLLWTPLQEALTECKQSVSAPPTEGSECYDCVPAEGGKYRCYKGTIQGGKCVEQTMQQMVLSINADAVNCQVKGGDWVDGKCVYPTYQAELHLPPSIAVPAKSGSSAVVVGAALALLALLKLKG